MYIKNYNKIIFSIIFFFLFFFIFNTSIFAKINVKVDRFYEITEDKKMVVTEVRNIKNDTENKHIPADETIEFNILGFRLGDPDEDDILKKALSTAVITEGGTRVVYNSEFKDNSVRLFYKYGQALMPGEERNVKLVYEHPGLIYQNGVVIDAYIHAFDDKFPFETENNSFTFTTKLIVPEKLPERNFVNPEPDNISESSGKTIYNFSQNKLVGNYVWLQLGRSQIYDFEIIQDVYSTEDKLTGLVNKFEFILPRNFIGADIKQTVFYEEIEPEPKYLYQDELGNLISVFEFRSDENTQITVKGYAKIEKQEKVDFSQKSKLIKDIPQDIISMNTSSSRYWEVDDQVIQLQAEELNQNREKVYDSVKDIYNFVVNQVDYDQVKRFGLNERQGAVKTLQIGSGVCMEYADLFITLARAQGIPSRAAFGYGFDPRISSESQEAHQWAQVYIPGVENNWVDVEVTWGENGEIMIGGDLNHFYTHFATVDPDTPPMISRYSYNEGGSLEPPEFQIKTLASIPIDKNLLKTEEELLLQYPLDEETGLEIFVTQIKNRYNAGMNSLQQGIDFDNSSQLLVMITIIALLLAAFVLLAKIVKWVL